MEKAYVDTCIISGIVKSDLKSTDQEAVQHIFTSFIEGKLQLCGSTVALDEINRIPAEYRTPHEDTYRMLNIMKGSTFEWIDEGTPSSAVQRPDIDPIYIEMRDLLPDENDARHLYLAKKNGATTFITADKNTILVHAEKLKKDYGITATNPSGYFASTHDW